MSELESLMQTVRESPVERPLAIARLMELAREIEMQTAVFAACLHLCIEEVLCCEDFESHVATLLNFWKDIFDQARSVQQSAGKLDWMIVEPYSGIRCRAEHLLDLMGYLPIRQVESRLRDGLSLSDPRLKLFAALSLLRNLETVDLPVLEEIAASHESRIVLWNGLQKMGMESLMPRRWSGPEMLAASELSRWISHPMELGVPPAEISLMGTFSVDIDGSTADVYLFRFHECRKSREVEADWMAGIAGPIRDGQVIGSCWSSFESWNSRTPEEHFTNLYRTVS